MDQVPPLKVVDLITPRGGPACGLASGGGDRGMFEQKDHLS